MKNVKYILLGFIVFTSLQGYCQKTIPVTLKTLYRGEGVVFGADCKLPFKIGEDTKRFTPSIEDITKAETLLLSNSVEVKYRNLIGKYEPSKLKKKLYTYNRQYVGYQNTVSDSIVLINLLNFRNKKIAKENFPNWQNSYIVGFGRFYESNTLLVVVNLSTKEVSTF